MKFRNCPRILYFHKALLVRLEPMNIQSNNAAELLTYRLFTVHSKSSYLVAITKRKSHHSVYIGCSRATCNSSVITVTVQGIFPFLFAQMYHHGKLPPHPVFPPKPLHSRFLPYGEKNSPNNGQPLVPNCNKNQQVGAVPILNNRVELFTTITTGTKHSQYSQGTLRFPWWVYDLSRFGTAE